MLSLENKIEYFKNYLETKNDNYGDFMKEEIYFQFFENGNDFNFLKDLKTEKEIELKIEFLVSKMILNEDQDSLTNILFEYI